MFKDAGKLNFHGGEVKQLLIHLNFKCIQPAISSFPLITDGSKPY